MSHWTRFICLSNSASARHVTLADVFLKSGIDLNTSTHTHTHTFHDAHTDSVSSLCLQWSCSGIPFNPDTTAAAMPQLADVSCAVWLPRLCSVPQLLLRRSTRKHRCCVSFTSHVFSLPFQRKITSQHQERPGPSLHTATKQPSCASRAPI